MIPEKRSAILCKGSADPGHPNGKPCDGVRHGLKYAGTDSLDRIVLECRCGALEVPVTGEAYRNRRLYFAAHPLEAR